MYNISIVIDKKNVLRHEVRSSVWQENKFDVEASFCRVFFRKKSALKYATIMGLALDFAYNTKELIDEDQ